MAPGKRCAWMQRYYCAVQRFCCERRRPIPHGHHQRFRGAISLPMHPVNALCTKLEVCPCTATHGRSSPILNEAPLSSSNTANSVHIYSSRRERTHQYGAVTLMIIVGATSARNTIPTAPGAISLATAIMIT